MVSATFVRWTVVSLDFRFLQIGDCYLVIYVMRLGFVVWMEIVLVEHNGHPMTL